MRDSANSYTYFRSGFLHHTRQKKSPYCRSFLIVFPCGEVHSKRLPRPRSMQWLLAQKKLNHHTCHSYAHGCSTVRTFPDFCTAPQSIRSMQQLLRRLLAPHTATTVTLHPNSARRFDVTGDIEAFKSKLTVIWPETYCVLATTKKRGLCRT